MKIRLEYAPNCDIPGGYWRAKPVCPRVQKVSVDSLAEASCALLEWVGELDLGVGNMARRCGEVTDDSGKIIAKVSYDGRVWEPGEWPTKEIVLG